MNLKELLNTSPEQLANLQRKELKLHALRVLNKIIKLIEDDNYKTVKDCLFSSPAGDGYGMDNECINFGFDPSDNTGAGIKDIGEICDMLIRLEEIIKGKKK